MTLGPIRFGGKKGRRDSKDVGGYPLARLTREVHARDWSTGAILIQGGDSVCRSTYVTGAACPTKGDSERFGCQRPLRIRLSCYAMTRAKLESLAGHQAAVQLGAPARAAQGWRPPWRTGGKY